MGSRGRVTVGVLKQMDSQAFDIFSGSPDRDPLWLETVAGLQKARAAMEDRAAKNPGPYFIFCTSTNSVVANVDTTPRASGGTA